MRLIDADKLEELCDIMAEKCGGIGENIWNQFHTTVEWCPTVDVQERGVVICKDCRWGREAGGIIECYSNIQPEYHGYDWFCPNGERREDAEIH